MPAAEVEMPRVLVHALLLDQAPDLADLPLRLLGNGWDNAMWRLGDDLAVRLPRRAAAADLLLHEQRWLPGLAPRLPLPVPAPVRVGRPALGYPWSWSVVPWLPGDVAARTPPEDAADCARRLGEFLAALHVPAPPEAPVNPFRGGPLSGREEVVRKRLALLGKVLDEPGLERVWTEIRTVAEWGGPPLWLHGDLHAANVLVHDARLSGIIDFGDITSGDPATDLSVAWMLLPAGHRDEFRDAYGRNARFSLDDPMWTRARGWALALSLAFLANSADNALIAGIGRRTLAAVLE